MPAAQSLRNSLMLFAFPTASSCADKLKPAAEAMFGFINKTPGSTGIVFGGAAAVFLGSKRQTRDLDINVSIMPNTRGATRPLIYDRPGSDSQMRKITFKEDDPSSSVKCDISTRKRDIVRRFYRHPYIVRVEGLEGVIVASPSLLLADKIVTSVEREAGRDILDVVYCMEMMYILEMKMDSRLRGLYTPEQWFQVEAQLKAGGHSDIGELSESIEVLGDRATEP